MLTSHGWDQDVVDTMVAAVQAARSGTKNVVLVEGGPGTGKTTLLQDVVTEATSFRMVSIEGAETSSTHYAALTRAGLLAAPSSTDTFAVAQALRIRLDELASAPLLLCIDDLQWVDSESVEALTWLLRRLAGDRILTVVGTRELPADRHQSWQRWVRTSASVQRLTLSGLSESAALDLASSRRPTIFPETARLLWQHTDGNPLYLIALLDEHDPADVTHMRVLPAPAQFERVITQQLARLDPVTVDVVRAAAVLGADWTSLPVLASVSQAADVARAAQQAHDVGLLQLHDLHGGIAARPSHSLVRAAIYHATPLPQRRALHRRAAEVTAIAMVALEHRVQAVDMWDDDLAGQLEARAGQLHAETAYRLAAQSLEWSSTATSHPAARLRRHLDACYEALLAGQPADVESPAPSLDAGANARMALLRGFDAVLDGRPDDAVRILATIVATCPLPDDPMPYFRVNTLLAWARLLAGGATDAVLADFARAEATGVFDPALTFYTFYGRSIATARSSSPEELAEQVAFLPEAVADVPPDQRYLLAWRGDMRLFRGIVPEAIADIRDAIKQVEARGGSDLRDGGMHGALGVAHWLHGEWDLARVAFNLVRDIADRPLPIVLTYLPLYPAGVGDFAVADQLLDDAMETCERMPWQEAVQQLFITRVVRAHAGGDSTQQAMLLDEMRQRWPRALVDTGLVSSFWALHAALAAIWADDHDYADRIVGRLVRPDVARWCPAAAAWLRGLAAEGRGEDDVALSLLRAGSSAGASDTPLYYAHMHSDHGRVAARLGYHAESRLALERAQRLYRTLGAVPYLTTTQQQKTSPGTAPTPLCRDFGLTGREQDIATLIAAGMSYVQIARELFITRSTVNYHLGNIYAKVGVGSRHELSLVLRTNTAS